jgi:RNA polymerase sigma factor (sigma-70 family)
LNPEESCAQDERKEILSAALSQLSPTLRKTIELRELGELSTEEAARVMGLSVTAVKGRAFHGRKKLQRLVKQLMSPGHSLRWTRQRVISRNPTPCAECG